MEALCANPKIQRCQIYLRESFKSRGVFEILKLNTDWTQMIWAFSDTQQKLNRIKNKNYTIGKRS
jgi:hypothetical protein